MEKLFENIKVGDICLPQTKSTSKGYREELLIYSKSDNEQKLGTVHINTEPESYEYLLIEQRNFAGETLNFKTAEYFNKEKKEKFLSIEKLKELIDDCKEVINTGKRISANKNGRFISIIKNKNEYPKLLEFLIGLLDSRITQDQNVSVEKPTSEDIVNIHNAIELSQYMNLFTTNEGRTLRNAHSRYERSHKLMKLAKSNYFIKNNHYKCEVCDFEFQSKYGEIGFDYIEGHHLYPLNNEPRETKPEDIAMVCSNCHRMIHRYIKNFGQNPSVKEFQEYLDRK